MLGYAQVRDSFETTRESIPQNTNTSSNEWELKVDAGAADLLNQQLLAARLYPNALSPENSIRSSPVKDQEQMNEEITRIRRDAADLKNQIKQITENIAELEERNQDVVSRMVTQKQTESTEIPTQTKTSTLFESQTFKPIDNKRKGE